MIFCSVAMVMIACWVAMAIITCVEGLETIPCGGEMAMMSYTVAIITITHGEDLAKIFLSYSRVKMPILFETLSRMPI